VGDPSLIDRLASLPKLSEAPREELEWLARHGVLETREVGEVVAPQGERIESLWVLVAGILAVRVDRGVGPRRVIEWHAGETSGMLPYSRMTAPPGDNYVERRAELLAIHQDLFPEMIQRCPTVTAQAVHGMIDRARSFNTSDLHDEKMVSLGRLAAGLAHELNNPAAATVRAAELLSSGLVEGRAAAAAVAGAGLTAQQVAAIEAAREATTSPRRGTLSALERADREEEILAWLEARGAGTAQASSLAETSLGLPDLDRLADAIPSEVLDAATRWIAAHANAMGLAADIGQAAGRIADLVGAVKRFTYMDSLAGPVAVEVEPGLRDTLGVLAAKAKSKHAAISLTLEPELPPVRANGGELNQIWLNLLDNALDAISASGRIEIHGERNLDRVVVRIVDDGPGIPPDVLPVIFDPFMTTKPPGQGTGLGLDFARRLARSYHGEITVESRPGRTEFSVSLPAEPV
jgi:signal transduction histidine kinase